MPEAPRGAAGSITIVECAVNIVLDEEAGERCLSLQLKALGHAECRTA
jgi:hypothetical protein